MLFRNFLAQWAVSSERFLYTSTPSSTSCLAIRAIPNLCLFVPVAVRSSYPFAFFKLQSHSYTNTKMPAESSISLRYVKLTSNAHSPSKGSEKAAGFDLKR